MKLIFIMGRESFKGQATFMEATLWGKAETFCVPTPHAYAHTREDVE